MRHLVAGGKNLLQGAKLNFFQALIDGVSREQKSNFRSVLEDLLEFEDNPTTINKLKSTLTECYRRFLPISHLVPSEKMPVNYSFEYGAFFVTPGVSFEEGVSINDAQPCSHSEFQNLFRHQLKNTTCIYTDGSKKNIDNKFGGFSVYVNTGESYRFRSVNYASIFSLEAMAIFEALRFAQSLLFSRTP